MKPKTVVDIGLNHNGDLDRALRMIALARTCGVDFVKFQKRNPDTSYKPAYLERAKKTRWGETVREEKWGLEFSGDQYQCIDSFCTRQGLEWFGSPRDVESVEFLASFNPPFLKIASGSLPNRDMLLAAAKTHIRLILATGMATYQEIDDGIKFIESAGGRIEYILHAVSLYPCPDEQLHMARIPMLQKLYGDKYKIGYSNHSPRIIHCVQAACMGAKMIEFHITEDRDLPGPDHKASIGPVGMKRIVDHLGNLEHSMGSPRFEPTAEELSKGDNYAWR